MGKDFSTSRKENVNLNILLSIFRCNGLCVCVCLCGRLCVICVACVWYTHMSVQVLTPVRAYSEARAGPSCVFLYQALPDFLE